MSFSSVGDQDYFIPYCRRMRGGGILVQGKRIVSALGYGHRGLTFTQLLNDYRSVLLLQADNQALRPPAVSPRTYCRIPNENRITNGMDAVMYAAIRGPMSVTPISEVN